MTMNIDFMSALDKKTFLNTENTAEIREAAKAVDKEFLKLLLKRIYENKTENLGEPAMQNFVNHIYFDTMSEHIVESGGIIKEYIENELLGQNQKLADHQKK